MDQEWQRDDCDEIKALGTSFSVIEAALRWCNVPDEMLDEIRREATPKSGTGVGRAIWVHPAVPCLEPRSALIARAIELGEMPQAREEGLPASDLVAHERRHVTGETLRDWMMARHPSEKPEFLFPNDSGPQIEKNLNSERIELSAKSEITYKNIVFALLAALKGEVPGYDKHPSYVSEADLIEKVSSHFQGYQGLARRTLEGKFADVKKSMDSQ